MWTLGLLILFGMFLSLPMTYKATRAVFGPWVAGANGAPERGGLLLHGLLLVLLLTVWSRTASAFTPGPSSGVAEPFCSAPATSPTPGGCSVEWAYNTQDVGKKCHVKGDPKGSAIGWVQPNGTCSYQAPPPIAPSQIFN